MIDVHAPLAADRRKGARDAERRRKSDSADQADQRPRIIGDEGARASRRQQGNLVTHLEAVKQPVRHHTIRLALNRYLVMVSARRSRCERIGPQDGNAIHERLHDNALPRLESVCGEAIRYLKAKRPHILVALDNLKTPRVRPERLCSEFGQLRQAAAADRPGPGLRRKRFHRCSAGSHGIKQLVARDAHALANEEIVSMRKRRRIDGQHLLTCDLHFQFHDAFTCLAASSSASQVLSRDVVCGFALQRPTARIATARVIRDTQISLGTIGKRT